MYQDGIKEIARRGIKIQSIICDGRKGLLSMFGDIPVQYCQFHQNYSYLMTKKPKLQASIELWDHVLLLTKTDKESFVRGLEEWYLKWKVFLNERKID